MVRVDLIDIAKLKSHCPELSSWGELALGCAWGEFSQDVYEIKAFLTLPKKGEGQWVALHIKSNKLRCVVCSA